MKSKFLVAGLAILMAFSCKKEDESQSCSTCSVGGSTHPSSGFSYVINNGSTVYADSAFFNASFRTITSYRNGIATRVNIKTSSQAAGPYSFTSSANTLSYTESTFTYIASGGSINITSNANNKLSGNFVSNGTGGGVISVTGQFQDIPLK